MKVFGCPLRDEEKENVVSSSRQFMTVCVFLSVKSPGSKLHRFIEGKRSVVSSFSHHLWLTDCLHQSKVGVGVLLDDLRDLQDLCF